MANWKRIMDSYESNDCESLGEYAAEHMLALVDYFKKFESAQDAADDALSCALYFVSIDHFFDGGEEDVLRHAIRDYSYKINYPTLLRNYEKAGYRSRVENLIRKAPSSVKERFAHLGCAICSGKGYISDAERREILKWV